MRQAALRFCVAAAALMAAWSPLPAQSQSHHGLNGSREPEGPRLGRVTFPTSETGQAQRNFVNGVLYLHSFEYDSAAVAFRRAQQLAPRFALAYWGEAMTYTHPVWNEQDLAAARRTLGRLAPDRKARLALAPTPRERSSKTCSRFEKR